jgi:AcrR family transcriptional regulator
MARTVKEQEYTKKRNDILNATQRLIYTKGYESMTIQDILSDLQISSGAFYHYFDSKPAVLEAFKTRMQEEIEVGLLPVVHDPLLTALEKLRGFFLSLDRLRMAHKADVVELGRVWYKDSNAIVRQKVDAAVLKQRGLLLNEIVRQGIQEGVFTTFYPDQAGEVISSLLHGMENTHARLLLWLTQDYDNGVTFSDSATIGSDLNYIEDIVRTHAAYMDAIERVLDAPPNSLYRVDAEAVNVWVAEITKELSYKKKTTTIQEGT